MHIISTQNKQDKFSWRIFLKHIFKDHIFENSATLSYYFLFSIFPLAMFISASFSALHISAENVRLWGNLIPEHILSILESYLEEITRGDTFTLISTGILLTLYSMGKAIQTMKRKFRLAYQSSPKIPFITEWIISLTFVFLMMVSFYATLIVIVSGNYIISWVIAIFPFLSDLLPSIQIIGIFAVTLYLFFVLMGIYYILPGVKQKKRDILPGTLFAMISWVFMSWLFSFYVEKMSSYTPLYGSLGTIIALLTWLFLVNLILLLGARINSYLYLRSNGKLHD